MLLLDPCILVSDDVVVLVWACVIQISSFKLLFYPHKLRSCCFFRCCFVIVVPCFGVVVSYVVFCYPGSLLRCYFLLLSFLVVSSLLQCCYNFLFYFCIMNRTVQPVELGTGPLTGLRVDLVLITLV